MRFSYIISVSLLNVICQENKQEPFVKFYYILFNWIRTHISETDRIPTGIDSRNSPEKRDV